MYNEFIAAGIGYVAVDEPPLSGLLAPDFFNTTDTALMNRRYPGFWRRIFSIQPTPHI